MIENICYMLKNWKEWEKKSICYFILRVPVLVVQPIISAYIPKVIIDSINNDLSLNKLIEIVLFLSMFLTVIVWLDPFMNELLEGSMKIIRMKYAIQAFQKNLYIPYEWSESINGQKSYNNAENFYRSYDSSCINFIRKLNQLCVCLIGSVSSIILISKVSIKIIILIFIPCIIEFIIIHFLNKTEYNIRLERNKYFTKFKYYYNQSKDFSKSKDIRIYGFNDIFIKLMAELVSECERLVSAYSKVDNKTSAPRAILNLIREIVSYIYLTILVSKGQISISEFVFFLGITTGFSSWIINLLHCFSGIEKCCNDCKIYREYINLENTYYDKQMFQDISTVEFKNVYFSYPESNDKILKNISFKAFKDEKVAIVGSNGAGKSTIVKLLCGLYQCTEGQILINGKTTKNPDLFSVMFQDNMLLPGTIAENVCSSENYDKERLYKSLQNAGILEKILSLKHKEKSHLVKDIFEDAVEFSGGEIQKLLLAKALYKNAPIIVLDEPTAALDSVAENELYSTYRKISKNRISFFITHRLSSTKFCDRIILLENGQIIEMGTHNELMNLKGKYYRMYKSQSSNYIIGKENNEEY